MSSVRRSRSGGSTAMMASGSRITTVPTKVSGRSGNGGSLPVYRAHGTTGLCQRLPTDALLWRAGDQDVCQAEGRDSGRLGESPRLREGGHQDYRPSDLPPTVSAEHGARPVALSALPSGDGGLEDMAPPI